MWVGYNLLHFAEVYSEVEFLRRAKWRKSGFDRRCHLLLASPLVVKSALQHSAVSCRKCL
jgi:hypothetical protein